MGRSSSTGFPFLVVRADAGQYTYHREVPAALAPLIVGDVFLPWCGRARTLAGKSTVKVSLGTGDQKTAHQRWAAVHPQIDALVQLAELRVRSSGTEETQADAPRLNPAHILTVAVRPTTMFLRRTIGVKSNRATRRHSPNFCSASLRAPRGVELKRR